MKLINSLVYALLSMTTLAILASCQDEDFGYTTEEVRAGVYDRNFIKHYGEIDPNQSWDLSSYGLIDRINAATNMDATRAGTDDYGTWCPTQTSVTEDGYTIKYTKTEDFPFAVSHDLLQWLKKRLNEGDNNTPDFGQRFSMIATEKSFSLMPIYQGIDKDIWDFHVLIEWLDKDGVKHTTDQVLWQKSEGMEMLGERPDNDGNSEQDYINTMTPLRDLSAGAKDEVWYETTRLAADISSNYVTVSGYPEMISEINFYIHVLSDLDDSNNIGKHYSDSREKPTSAISRMTTLPLQIQYDVTKLNNREVVLLGCEVDGDNDLNDIVFLLIGDETSGKLPQFVNLNDIRKRYFFEDLGSVVDWDFNDVVLDMEHYVYLEGGKKKYEQTATLKHRCGTTPFKLFVKNGDTYTELVFSDLVDNEGYIPGYNEGPKMEYTQKILVSSGELADDKFYPTGTGWDPQENNVAIKVFPSKSNNKVDIEDGSANTEGVWNEFHGRTGKIPRVFVADQSVWWTSESTDFPNMWEHPETAITTKPINATENDLTHDRLYGMGSDRYARYPKLEGDKMIIWEQANANEPTQLDHYEPLWLSEGFIEALAAGYTKVNIELADCNSDYALLYRHFFANVDHKYNGFQNVPTNKTITYVLPTGDTDAFASVEWFKARYNPDQSGNGYRPSFGIQNDASGGGYIQIKSVYMTKPADGEAEDPLPLSLMCLGETHQEGDQSKLNSSAEIKDWSSTTLVTLGEVHESDLLIFEVSNVASNAQATLRKDNSWNNFNPAISDAISGNFTLRVSKEMINDFQDQNAYQVLVAGDGFTLTGVYVRHSAECTSENKDIEWNTVYNFKLNDKNWLKDARMTGDKFNDANVGDKVTVNIKDIQSGAQIAFKQMGDWDTALTGYVNLNTNDTEASFFIDSEDLLNKLKTNGLAIQGKGYTIVNVVKTSPARYQVTAQSANESMGTVSGTNQYSVGARVNLIATPVSNHYVFTNWTKDATVVSTNATYQFTMTEAAAGTYTANFSEAPTYTISVATASECSAMGSASVNGNATGYTGDNVHIVASPASEEYVFDHWNDNNKSADRYVTIGNSNQTYTAYFKEKPDTPEPLVWRPAEPVTINKNWSDCPTIPELNEAINSFLTDYEGRTRITFTASEITESGDNVFHLLKGSWGGVIYEGINISSKSATIELDSQKTKDLRDSGAGFQSGIGFKLSEVTIEKIE